MNCDSCKAVHTLTELVLHQAYSTSALLLQLICNVACMKATKWRLVLNKLYSADAHVTSLPTLYGFRREYFYGYDWYHVLVLQDSADIVFSIIIFTNLAIQDGLYGLNIETCIMSLHFIIWRWFQIDSNYWNLQFHHRYPFLQDSASEE